jgi:hypothetical protein
MELSTAEMALMSRLLDEALPLDDAGRHAWLERLSRTPSIPGLMPLPRRLGAAAGRDRKIV